jgi:hypothetical protein
VRTVEKLRAANVATLQQRVKVSRGEMQRIIFRSLACCAFPPLWRKLYVPAGKAVDSGEKFA